MSTSAFDVHGYCYFWLSLVVELTDFELAVVDSPRFAVGKQRISFSYRARSGKNKCQYGTFSSTPLVLPVTSPPFHFLLSPLAFPPLLTLPSCPFLNPFMGYGGAVGSHGGERSPTHF